MFAHPDFDGKRLHGPNGPPMAGGNFHQADEWVDLPSIAAAVRVLLRLALDVLSA